MKLDPLCPNDMGDALALVNPWQRDFPLVREPYAVLAQQLGRPCPEVLDLLKELRERGALSRIGGVFNARAGGAALLSAMAVPPERLHEVAAIVSAHPGVNHNYEREDRFNLWFVMTACDEAALEQAMLGLERASGLQALRLRMVRPYRIDLGFDMDMQQRTAGVPAPQREHKSAPPVASEDRALAALVEEGLPLVERPFDRWAETLGCAPETVLDKLQDWLDAGTLRRMGAIVRHHEFGFGANAMTVFNVPDDQVDERGMRLAQEAGVTLAYRRERAATWPYNLYCMVHGTDREAAQAVIARVIANCGLAEFPHRVLFSRQRFKQTGARRFRALPSEWNETDTSMARGSHALA